MEEVVSKKEDAGKLGFYTILLITVNSIMGTGIFFLPAIGAREAGVFSIVSWILMSVIATYFGMIFAELIGIYPKEGGVYEYAKEAFGHFPSFMLGWATMVAANLTIAMLIIGAIKYIGPVLPSRYLIMISLGFIFAFNYMSFKGMKTSSVMLVAFAIITLISVFGIIIPGLFQFNIDNFSGAFDHPALDSSGGLAGFLGGIPIILLTVFFISETFFGWETATFLAEKVKNPKEVMPKIMTTATTIICIISILFVISCLSIIRWNVFGESATPLADLAEVLYGAEAVPIYRILVYLAIIGSVAGWIVSSPQLIVALAKDKLFIASFADMHKKNNTPYKAILFQTVLSSILVLIGAGSYETLLELLLPLVLMLYAAVVFSLYVIRKKNPNIEKPYTAPFGNTGLFILIGLIFGLVFMWISHTHSASNVLMMLFGFISFGIPLFLLLNFYYNPQAIRKIKDKFAVLTLVTEGWNLPRRLRKDALNLLGNLKGKNILEHGCSVGTFTLDLANAVGPVGKIYATNISKGEIDILQSRLNKNEILNVHAIHDEHHSSRIHPNIPNIDLFVSIGSLSYIQDIHKIASQIYSRLKLGGKICIIEYVDLYKVLPNAGWLNDHEAIIEIFRENGFMVRIVKKRGLFWNYLFIYGIKTKKDKAGIPFI